MPGKFHDGYTKQAQKVKFVRNRDIKMKESELRQEEKIRKLMCEGICRKCREKVQWRFNFDKYKPLRNPGTCQNCKQKTVTKAYRTWCDRCAASKDSCPGCCVLLEIANLPAPEIEKEGDAVEVTVQEGEVANEPESATVPMDTKVAAAAVEEEGEPDTEAASIDNDEDEDNESIDDQAEDQDLAEGAASTADDEKLLDSVATSQLESMEGIHWNEKKFVNVAATKYAKTRQVVAAPAATVDSSEGQEEA